MTNKVKHAFALASRRTLSFSTALFGMLVLTLGMGLGRFLYTPMLPVTYGRIVSFSQLSDCQRQLCGVSGWQSAIFVWRISPTFMPAPTLPALLAGC